MSLPPLKPPPLTPPPRAIVLAAGRGERMRPLSDHTPKPLLPVQGRPLAAHHLAALARDGVREVVVNTAWLEAQFPATLGDGAAFGLDTLRWSHEGAAYGGALETAGGIATVLPWLAEAGRPVFWAVSGDIWSPDFRFDPALAAALAASELLGLLWLVPNPGYHASGDFALGAPCPALGGGSALGISSRDPALHAAAAAAGGNIDTRAGTATPAAVAPGCLTYANLALFKPTLFDGVAPGRKAALGPLLHAAMLAGRLAVRAYTGRWANVGTPAELAALQGGDGHPAT